MNYTIRIVRQVSFVIYAMLIVVMALATFFEHFHGTEAAQECFYSSWWFGGLWIAALASSVLCIHKHFRWIGRLFRHKPKGYPKTKGAAGVFILSCFLAIPSIALASEIRTVARTQADSMKRAQVAYNGRTCPLNTTARDFVLKLTGKTSFGNLTAEQVLLSWNLYPEDWKDVNMIKVKNVEVRRKLGIKSNMACFADFFDSEGKYRLKEGKHLDIEDKLTTVILLTQGRLFTPITSDSHRVPSAKIEAEIWYNAIPWQPVLFSSCFFLALIIFALSYRIDIDLHRYWRLLSMIKASLAALLFVSLIIRWCISGHIPLTSTYETLQAIALAALILSCVLPSYSMAALLVAGSTLMVSHLCSLNPHITSIMPALDSPWLSSHVTTIMLSYCLFALLTFRPNRRMLVAAELLLGAGIILGGIWAKTAWGAFWQWDPKETWALITFLVYMYPLHKVTIPWFANPKHTAAYLRIAFLTVLMTYFGCNYVLSGLHSYAG